MMRTYYLNLRIPEQTIEDRKKLFWERKNNLKITDFFGMQRHGN